MAVMNLTLDLPADLFQRVHALPVETINRYAVAALHAAAERETQHHILDDSEVEPTSKADALLVAEAVRAHQAGESKGKSPAASYAALAAKYGFKNPTL